MKLFGLPAHPLLVHLPIVLVPFTSLAVIWFVALRSKVTTLRATSYRSICILTFFSACAVLAAGQSGESLQHSLPANPNIRSHADLGDTMKPLSLALFLVVLIFAIATNKREKGSNSSMIKIAARTFAVLALTLSIVTTYWVVRVGHSGAKATWSKTVAHSFKKDNSHDPR